MVEMQNEKDIKIVIDIKEDKTNISITGLNSEQSSYFTPKILAILDEMKNQQIVKY